MNWLNEFQLFLFDFDGLLVNTEPLHYKAYKESLAGRGIDLGWSVERFYELAHLNATALRDAICQAVPDLGVWENFYQEKKALYQTLLEKEPVLLMAGAEKLLTALARTDLRRCIVTNSSRENLERIAHLQPILRTLPWVAREDYREPKPNPECYRLARAIHGQPGDRAIGFEDSVRGWTALCETPVEVPVLIGSIHQPPKGAICAATLDHLCNSVTFP